MNSSSDSKFVDLRFGLLKIRPVGDKVAAASIRFSLESWGYVDSGFRSWLTISGASPFVAVMLFAMSSGRGVLGRAPALRPMVLLGPISFSLYLVHQLVSRVWLLRKDFGAEYSDLARYLAYWAFVLLLSYLLWRFVEKPAQLLLMGKLRATEAPKPVSM